MAALGWLTPRRRTATGPSVLAGEAAAVAARKNTGATEP
ncbi:HAD-IB family hydrolase, partial [Streptomyces sp. NPDC059627]